jgi:hypothetical protein
MRTTWAVAYFALALQASVPVVHAILVHLPSSPARQVWKSLDAFEPTQQFLKTLGNFAKDHRWVVVKKGNELNSEFRVGNTEGHTIQVMVAHNHPFRWWLGESTGSSSWTLVCDDVDESGCRMYVEFSRPYVGRWYFGHRVPSHQLLGTIGTLSDWFETSHAQPWEQAYVELDKLVLVT